MKRSVLRSVLSALIVCLAASPAFSASSNEAKKNNSSSDSSGSKRNDTPLQDLPATDPAYKLTRGDEVAINVFNENEVSTAQKIDNRGIVRIPYVGEVPLAGRTVREAESYLEKLFVDKRLLVSPMVTIGVRGYASRELSVLGAVNGPGKYRLPVEASDVEILDVITGMGGFKPGAEQDKVKVTRTLDSGEEKVITVNVEAMINPRRASSDTPRSFLVYPGDRIYVPERLW